MIDERQEELAALYALGLLSETERTEFEAQLSRDADLRTLVRELRESSAALAHTAAPTEPPAALKARILDSINAADAQPRPRPSNLIPFPFVPWAIAAGLAIAAGWVGQLYFSTRTENARLGDQVALAAIETKTAQNQLEAERIISARRLADSAQQVADGVRRLADVQRKADDADQQRAFAQAQEATARHELADANARIVATEKLLASATAQASDLSRELKAQGDLANLKIATLVSKLNNAPDAIAVAVWNPTMQEGVVALDKMPALPANQNLELWVVEAKAGAKPVSAGVFTVSAEGGTRRQFKTVSPVTAIAAFAISRETNDGAAAHAAPGEVIMIGPSH